MVPRDYLCEHQSCYTKEGFECIFPFTYKDVVQTKCTSEDVYQPWCATQLEGDRIVSLDSPQVPMFGNSSNGTIIIENYKASWFNLSFLRAEIESNSSEEQQYLITRDVRKISYSPLVNYDRNNLFEENLTLIAKSQFDPLHNVYEIIPHNGEVNYTCPAGWVFEGSKNVTQTSTCQN